MRNHPASAGQRPAIFVLFSLLSPWHMGFYSIGTKRIWQTLTEPFSQYALWEVIPPVTAGTLLSF
jgi:hypothetical protein